MAACLLAVVAASCGGDEEGPSPPGPVLLVGDSLFFQAAGELERALHEDGLEVMIAAQPGAGLGGGGYADIDWARRLDERLRRIDPDVAVVELGIAETRDNLELLPYHRWLDGRRELVQADGVHLTTQGQQVVAARVSDAVRTRSDVEP